jgi:hypothetical protein
MRRAAGLLVLLLAGCGSAVKTSTESASNVAAPPQVQQMQHDQGKPAKPDGPTMSVIRGWSSTLRKGDVEGAARYFAVPSLLINGPGQDGEPYVTAIRSFSQAVSANASLPCGAELISAQQRGRYVDALFRLTDRPGAGGGCGRGVGGTARTNFLIKHGRIVEWIRAPSEPGDPGAATHEV